MKRPPWPPLVAREARKCSAAHGQHSEAVPQAFWRLVSKSCDECKGSFARGCGAKRWSHWTCSSLGTIFQPMRINPVPDVKCFCNHKNLLRAQSMVWHFVRHPVDVPIMFLRHACHKKIVIRMSVFGIQSNTVLDSGSGKCVIQTWFPTLSGSVNRDI